MKHIEYMMESQNDPHWLLALESSTPFGGAALLHHGEPVATILLEEGLRHGRELLAAGAELLRDQGIVPRDLAGVAVSSGPGSYTGIRVGCMAAKALAYGVGCKLAAVSSLASLAQSLLWEEQAQEGDVVLALQDARRDEVYAGVYAIQTGFAISMQPDVAITPEEAARLLERIASSTPSFRVAGSSFHTYGSILGTREAYPGRVAPAAVGRLGWRQCMQGEYTDIMQLQPVYLRRDAEADWRHDHLISEAKISG